MNRYVSLLLLGALGMALSGCDEVRSTLGVEKTSPDEFSVITHAPLSMPPDYALRPPRPGTVRPQDETAQAMAKSAITGTPVASTEVASAAGTDTGESKFLQQAGATNVDPNIRQQVDQETASLNSQSNSFVDRLIFWRETPPPGQVIDPAAEAKRLQENAALGKPVTTGTTPVIVRRKPALLEGIF
jgi:DUF3035 family protein